MNNWNTFSFPLTNNLISDSSIHSALDKFNEEILSTLLDTQYMLIIFRVKTEDNLYRNISLFQRINKSDKDELYSIFKEYWAIKSENYNLEIITEIIFTYKIIEDIFNIKSSKMNKPSDDRLKPSMLKFGSYNFPQTMDLYDWGDVDFILNDTEAIVYKYKSKAQYHIKFNNNIMTVDYILNGKTLISFTDELLDINNLGTFKRTIKTQVIHFIEGNLDYKEKHYIYPKITKGRFKPFLVNKYITMDIETVNIDGVLSPYAISYYDGKKGIDFYLTNYSDSESMLIDCIKSLMIRKYHNYKIYLHNLSNFDGIFLFNVLTKLSDRVEPIINDGKFINIKFKYGDGKYTLHFRDSLLMLPSSLRKLAKSFSVEDKTIFPYDFVTIDRINSRYYGPIPKYEYFTGVTQEQYKEYCKQFHKNWSLQSETMKYCLQDCRTLYLVLSKFFEQNFLDTRVNGSDSFSLPSLAFTNFRYKFLKDETFIPNIKGELYYFIKEGYTGGAVDVYKPYGKNIYRYDVNSLYPYIMSNNPMPVGNPTYIEGSSDTILSIIKDKNKFSFIEVEVNCPDNIKAPLLLHRVNNKTLAPTGSWKGVYTSIEILRAIELGYKFKYIKGVYFNTEIIFKEYVEHYYEMKQNSDKNSVGYMIAKLMLNSLYGRFGMSPYLDSHTIVNSEEVIKLSENNKIVEILPLNNGKELVTYSPLIIDDDIITSKCSMSIAAAITAGARVHMSYLKNLEGNTLYYSDTDSIDLGKPLQDKYVGPELGKLKWEQGGKGDPNEKVYIWIWKVLIKQNPLSLNELIYQIKCFILR